MQGQGTATKVDNVHVRGVTMTWRCGTGGRQPAPDAVGRIQLCTGAPCLRQGLDVPH
jgi:hypothetical protein